MERLMAMKQAAQTTNMERFNLTKLSELEIMKQYQTEISNRFVALENSNDGEDINRACENIKEIIRISPKK
jgi:hypothetical protein